MQELKAFLITIASGIMAYLALIVDNGVKGSIHPRFLLSSVELLRKLRKSVPMMLDIQ